MVNKTPAPEKGGEEKPLYPDYWILNTWWEEYTISTAMVRVLQRELKRWPRPMWIYLVDIAGARVMVRTELIRTLRQSSPETRALWERIRKEQEQENPEADLGL